MNTNTCTTLRPFYRPQGNVFTGVCHSFCPRGGVPRGRRCVALDVGGIHPPDTTLPGHLPPPWTYTPWTHTHPGHPPSPWKHTPRHHPGHTHILNTHTLDTPQTHTAPLGHTPPDIHTPEHNSQQAGGTHPTGMFSCFLVTASVFLHLSPD